MGVYLCAHGVRLRKFDTGAIWWFRSFLRTHLSCSRAPLGENRLSPGLVSMYCSENRADGEPRSPRLSS